MKTEQAAGLNGGVGSEDALHELQLQDVLYNCCTCRSWYLQVVNQNAGHQIQEGARDLGACRSAEGGDQQKVRVVPW